MKVIRTTATAHILKNKAKHIDQWQSKIFGALKEIFKPYAENLNVVASTENHYELWTNLGYRSKSFHVKRNKGIAFASIIVFDRYIGFYFYPLNLFKSLNELLPDVLKKNETGVYIIHLMNGDYQLIPGLRNLIKRGWNLYKENRLVRD